MTFSLTPEQQETYLRKGLLCIRQGVERSDALAMCDVLWEAMERKLGLHRDQPGTWTIERPTGLGAAIAPEAFARMASATVVSVLDVLLQHQWAPPTRWGVPLVSFPDQSVRWEVPCEQWHVDCPVTVADPPIARVFVVLAPLAPQGGGTVVVTGSHRLLRRLAAQTGKRLRSAQAKRLLCAEQHWFAALASRDATAERTARFMMEGCDIQGVHVQVTEMTGDPGDVYFMHPCLLHAPALNVQQSPRLMLTQWIERAGAAG
jgi:hypothetical protein